MASFKFNKEKGVVEKIVSPEEKERQNMMDEIEALKEKAKSGKLTLEEERRLWDLRKRVGDINIPPPEISTGQYL
jgi:hypothetical protein